MLRSFRGWVLNPRFRPSKTLKGITTPLTRETLLKRGFESFSFV